jgi:hypothetical protein
MSQKVKHQEETGAFVIIKDPLRDPSKDELWEDIEILKRRLGGGKFSSELDEEVRTK